MITLREFCELLDVNYPILENNCNIINQTVQCQPLVDYFKPIYFNGLDPDSKEVNCEDGKIPRNQRLGEYSIFSLNLVDRIYGAEHRDGRIDLVLSPVRPVYKNRRILFSDLTSVLNKNMAKKTTVYLYRPERITKRSTSDEEIPVYKKLDFTNAISNHKTLARNVKQVRMVRVSKNPYLEVILEE